MSGTLLLTDVWDGRFLEGTTCRRPVKVQGLAEAPGGVSSVEVFLDGESVGLARTGLPGRLSTIDQGSASSVAMFEASVVVPTTERRSPSPPA